MKNIVFQIKGCYGSQQRVYIEEFTNIKDARNKAKKQNQLIADSKGISLRNLYKQANFNFEGMYIAERVKDNDYSIKY